jgi:hypothetical protein
MLEDLPAAKTPDHPIPRASLVLAPGEATNIGALWMGGAHALRGEAITIARLQRAWLIDAAGDMPPAHSEAAGRLLSCVFMDIEATPPSFARLEEVALAGAAALRSGHVAEVYAVCTHGLNRSGLVAGMVLRALGLPAGAAIDRIRVARPGSLANHAFEQLIRDFTSAP